MTPFSGGGFDTIAFDAGEEDIDDLFVLRGVAGTTAGIQVLDEIGAEDTGSMLVGKISAADSIELRAVESILDAFDDEDSIIVNVRTPNGDVHLQAGADIGAADNFLDVDIGDGALSGAAEGDVFIRSVTDLDVAGSPGQPDSGLTARTGNVNLRVWGDANIGLIRAPGDGSGDPDGLARIVADGFILDRRDDGLANIQARGALLRAGEGAGTEANKLDTEVGNLEAFVAAGSLWLHNTGDLVLGGISVEVDDLADPGGGIDPEVGVFASAVIDITAASDLVLDEAEVGATVVLEASESILDDGDSDALDIIATDTVLTAGTGAGLALNALETRTSRLEAAGGSGGIFVDDRDGLVIGDVTSHDAGPATDGLNADGDIRVATTGFMRVVENVASGGANVELEAVDSPATTGPSENIPQPSILVRDGDAELFFTAADGSDADEDFALSEGRAIEAAGDVRLFGGDDVLVDTGTTVRAGQQAFIRGDHGNADAGAGTRIDILGTLDARATETSGERDADVIYLRPDAVNGHVRVLGDTDGQRGGDDKIILDRLPAITGSTDRPGDGTGEAVRDTIDLDGRGGNDDYVVFTRAEPTSYVVNVHDSGEPDDGADRLVIEGTAEDDTFLIRRNFVAHLHEDTAAGPDDRPVFDPDFERINYDRSINGRLRVDGLEGNDAFYSDDNSALTTLDGGPGEDFFQIGQVFENDRVAPQVAGGDEIETVETTLGFLTIGTSFATTVYGGGDGDRFIVYSNKAPLKLFGEAGNDEFVVRAFVLAGSEDLSTNDTDVFGGDGDDLVEYNINAPVSIDGGAGADTVAIIGTEVSDSFVITEDGVQGAGLNVDFTAVEQLEVDGLEGDDRFFVLSTNEDMVTTIIGGLGSDTIEVGGDVTAPIVARSVEGRSGVINHSVFSDDEAFDDVFVDGIQLNIADASSAPFIVDEKGGVAVAEGGEAGDETDSYTIRTSVDAGSLANATVAYVTVSAALANFKDDQKSGKTLEISTDGGTTFAPTAVLTFDSDAAGGSAEDWNREQEILVRGIDDPAAEGERDIVVSHSVRAFGKDAGGSPDPDNPDPVFDGADLANVEVRLIDNDRPDAVVTELNRDDPADPATETVDQDSLVFEGDAGGDFYRVGLSRAPDDGETVTVALAFDDSEIAIAAAPDENGDVDPRLDVDAGTIAFTHGDWDDPATVKVTAVDDADIENRERHTIAHSVSSDQSDGVFADVPRQPDIDVDVRDNDTAGVIVEESEGSTLVSETRDDSYTLELTREPEDDVEVEILTDGQTLVDAFDPDDDRFAMVENIPTVTFDAGNWHDPFKVRVSANPNAADDEGSQPLQKFSNQPHLLNQVRGPLIVEGSLIPTKDRSLTPPVALPTEDSEAPDLEQLEVDESLKTDTLRVFADGSETGDSGTLGAASEAGQSGLEAVYEVAELETLFPLSAFANLSGLDMGDDKTIDFGTPGNEDRRAFDGGITYRGLEVVDILLGTGDDTFTVDDTSDGAITAVHGGGGGDTITVNGSSDDPASALILFGDTDQRGASFNFGSATVGGPELTFTHNDDGPDTIARDAGSWLDDGFQEGYRIDVVVENPDADGNKNFDDYTIDAISADGRTLFLAPGDRLTDEQNVTVDRVFAVPNGTGLEFTNPGHDTIDASGADARVAVFGGPGDDAITGSVFGDHLAGGSGEDAIDGLDGLDHIYGDSGFNIDLSLRLDRATELLAAGSPDGVQVLTVATAPDAGTNTSTGDFLAAGDDAITGDSGDDLILGDHGVIEQAAGVQRLATTGQVTRMASNEVDNGGDDTISGDGGADRIIAGLGDDDISGDAGADVIAGDHARIGFDPPVVAFADLDALDAFGDVLTPINQVQSTERGTGGEDTIEGNGDDDLILGGAAGDAVTGGEGHDLIFGDNGEVLLQAGVVTRAVSTDEENATGGDDVINGFVGDDIPCGDPDIHDDDVIIAGVGDDDVIGNLGDDVVIGDNGEVDYDTGDGDLSTLDLVQTIAPTLGGTDEVNAGYGNDIVLGGFAGDELHGEVGSDVLLGDNSRVELAGGLVAFVTATDESAATGGDDVITGDDDEVVCPGTHGSEDIIVGGVGADDLDGARGDDVIFGDNGEVTVNGGMENGSRSPIRTIDSNLGGADVIQGGDGDDAILGGAEGDLIDDTGGDNIVFGDHGEIDGDLRQTTDLRGGADSITTTDGDDVIFGGTAGDDIATTGGDNAIAGDFGRLDPTEFLATDTAEGGADAILSGQGNDRVLGGAAGDLIESSGGDNIVFGDSGRINGAGTNAVSIDPGTGGGDDITTGGGRDVVLGGAAGDTIASGGGDDQVLGDSGEVDAGSRARSFAPGTGGADTIDTGGGNDDVIGGAAGDTITSGAGDDNVTGDAGEIVPGRVVSLAPGAGGADTIDTGGGNDNVIGGAAGDTITSGAGDDNVIGDAGEILPASVLSTDPAVGGDDVIDAGGGDDDVIGGAGADDVEGGAGDDRILGDNGVIASLRTTSPTIGGDDRLSGGPGDDMIFGGFGTDTIDGGGGNDRILGDNGEWDGATLRTTEPEIGGDDVIDAGGGDDWGLGGFGDDTLRGGSGMDFLLGDNGRIEPFPGFDEGLRGAAGILRIATEHPTIGGADFIDGGPGNDVLIGGFGPDTFVGNLGEDVMIGDNGAVIVGPDGAVLQVDAFGQEPLDRFAQFNLFSRDLELTTPRYNELRDILTVSLADSYAMQGASMPDVHRFAHHHGEQPAQSQDEEAPEQDAAGDEESSGRGDTAEDGQPRDEGERTGEPRAPQTGPDQARQGEPAEPRLPRADEAPDRRVAAAAGGAAAIGLAGWRRRPMEGRGERADAGYRIVVDGAAAPERARGGSGRRRRLFDPASGRFVSETVH